MLVDEIKSEIQPTLYAGFLVSGSSWLFLGLCSLVEFFIVSEGYIAYSSLSDNSGQSCSSGFFLVHVFLVLSPRIKIVIGLLSALFFGTYLFG